MTNRNDDILNSVDEFLSGHIRGQSNDPDMPSEIGKLIEQRDSLNQKKRVLGIAVTKGTKGLEQRMERIRSDVNELAKRKGEIEKKHQELEEIEKQLSRVIAQIESMSN